MDSQLRNLHISAASNSITCDIASTFLSREVSQIRLSKKKVLGVLPKRISLSENLEFQPQMLLNLKKSIYVENQLVASTNCSKVANENHNDMINKTGIARQQQKSNSISKHALKVRLQQQHQKRLNKTRLQIFRQQVKLNKLFLINYIKLLNCFLSK